MHLQSQHKTSVSHKKGYMGTQKWSKQETIISKVITTIVAWLAWAPIDLITDIHDFCSARQYICKSEDKIFENERRTLPDR